MAAALSLGLGWMGGALSWARLGRLREHRTVPVRLCDWLLWAYLVDEGVVLGKDGSLPTGWSYRGPDTSAATAEDLDALSSHVSRAMLPLGNGWMLHWNAVRHAAPGYAPAGGVPGPGNGAARPRAEADLRGVGGELRDGHVRDGVVPAAAGPLLAAGAALRAGRAERAQELGRGASGFLQNAGELERRLSAVLRIRRLSSDELLTLLHGCLTGLDHVVRARPRGRSSTASYVEQSSSGTMKRGPQGAALIVLMLDNRKCSVILRSLNRHGRSRMRAWTVREFGPFRDVLRLEEQPSPAATNGCALVRVRAADINFPDLLMIAGRYQVRPELPFTPGFAVAGEVVLGGEAIGLNAGDRVVCPLPFGGFREYLCVPVQDVFPIPPSMSEAAAAAFFLIFQTAWFALCRARLRVGETLLVHAGASGVGTAAIQYGKVLGATIIATAGGPEKVELCQRLGADFAVDSRSGDFVAAVQEITGGSGADVIFDPVGGDVFDRSLKCIAWEGRILPIGFASGNIPKVPVNRVLLKNIAVRGMYWSSYWANASREIREAHGELLGLYEQGRIAPVIDRYCPLEELPRALEALEKRECRGKAVLAVGP